MLFRDMVDDLCSAVGRRIAVVEAARPLTVGALGELPPNIFEASGDWQIHSTPGRDVTLRGSLKEIFRFASGRTNGSDGRAVSRRLLNAWNDRNRSCALGYKSSTGSTIALSLGELVKRAYKLSFDPYHCPELRWGADSGAEFATCNTQDEAQMARYVDAQTLRNYVKRPPSGTPTPLGSGPAAGEDIDFVALLQRRAE